MGVEQKAELDRLERYHREKVREHAARYAEFHWPSSEVMFNVLYTYDVVVAELARALAAHNLSPSSFNALMVLQRAGSDGMNLGELSELLVVSRSNVTGLLDYLERRGLVARTASSGDRRVRVATITPDGEALIAEIAPNFHAEVRRMCSSLGAAEKRDLCQLLAKLRAGIRRSSPEGGRKRTNG